MLVAIFVGVCFAYLAIAPFISYLRDVRSLRKFPSPSYAALSSIWRITKNIKKKHYLAVHKAHMELGTHVRISPNHVSVADPQAMNEIYGHGANFLKDGWYDAGAGPHRDMGNTRDKAEHQAKRKMFAHVFAQKTIASLEPVVSQNAAVLIGEIDRKAEAGEVCNIRRYVNYFTIDLISSLLYGESLGCMGRGNDIVDAETKDGRIYKAGLIDSLHKPMSIATFLGFETAFLPWTKPLFSFHPYVKAGKNFENIVYHNTMKRLRKADTGDDFFEKLLVNGRGEKLNLPMGEILAECSVIMNAGTDTTTSALTSTIYLLVKNPEAMATLRKELDPVMRGCDVPTYDSVANLPYLRACIEESLRLRPAQSIGLPRIVPKGGRVIAGQFIHEDVIVSVPTWTLLRDAQVFENPERYDPDRWFSEHKEKMSKVHLPFSVGPRACIGRNIAYFEQIILVAMLAYRYDFELPSEDFELENVERLNSNPGELPLKCRRRFV
jgi:cytochrome P450